MLYFKKDKERLTDIFPILQKLTHIYVFDHCTCHQTICFHFSQIFPKSIFCIFWPKSWHFLLTPTLFVHTSYLSFFYTHTNLGPKVLHSKVRKFLTKKAPRQNRVNLRHKLNTVCKINYCVWKYTLCAKLHTVCRSEITRCVSNYTLCVKEHNMF